MLNRIVTALVFSGLLISVPAFAAPDGSLKKIILKNGGCLVALSVGAKIAERNHTNDKLLLLPT